MKTIQITTTKRGFPAMWESGGGMSNTGHAQIITGRNGESRRPVYIRRSGHLAGGEHALITVHQGFHVVNVDQHRGDCSISIWRIMKVSVEDIDGEKWEATTEVDLVNRFDNGEWNHLPDAKFEAAVKAAKSKALSYHCRSPYYIDTSAKPELSGDQKAKKAEEVRSQDEQRARLRQEKDNREARAKAEAEAASKVAKPELAPALDALNKRLTAIGHEPITLEEVSFKFGWQSQLYTEENVANAERKVSQLKEQHAESERRSQLREALTPRFKALKPRAEALGLTIELTDDKVRWQGDYYGEPYTEEGFNTFEAQLSSKEKEAE